jgi:hypothetical protein
MAKEEYEESGRRVNAGAVRGGKSLTLHNMSLVTIRRLPNGAVAVSGRKMAGRRNPSGRKVSIEEWDEAHVRVFTRTVHYTKGGTAIVKDGGHWWYLVREDGKWVLGQEADAPGAE